MLKLLSAGILGIFSSLSANNLQKEVGNPFENEFISGLPAVAEAEADANQNKELEEKFNSLPSISGYFYTPNYRWRKKGIAIDTIVIHGTGLEDLKAVSNEFERGRGRGVSAHYIVDRDGKIFQAVTRIRGKKVALDPKYFVTHHAAEYNNRSIGIEIVNCEYLNKDSIPTKQDKNSCGGVSYLTLSTEELRRELARPWYGYRDVQRDEVLEQSRNSWERFSLEQMNSTIQLVNNLKNRFGIQPGRIVAHSKIHQVKFDPGIGFDEEYFREVVFKKNYSADCGKCYDYSDLPDASVLDKTSDSLGLNAEETFKSLPIHFNSDVMKLSQSD